MSREVYLTTPIRRETIEQLELDDVVYISGTVYAMMFDSQFERLLTLLRRGLQPEVDLTDGVLYHTGTIFKKREDGTYDFRGIGATTSLKFNAQTPEVIERTGVRVIIGKGGMDSHVLHAMEMYGCVYLSVMGGCSAIYTPKVVAIEKEIWPQKGWAYNVLQLRVKEYGPLFVTMDAKGHSTYETIGANAEKNKKKMYKRLQISTS